MTHHGDNADNHNVIRAALALHQESDEKNVRELVQACLDMAEAITGSSIGFLHFVNKNEETIELVSWSTQTQKNCFIPGEPDRHYPVSKAGVWVDCILKRIPVIHNDYKALSHRKGLPQGHVPVIREAVVPVFSGPDIVAIIGVGNKETDYTDDDVNALSLLAKNLWTAIQRKRMEDALRESERRLSMAAQSAGIGFQEVDLLTGRITWDRTCYGIHGYPQDTPITRDMFKKDLHPDDMRLMYPLYEKALKSNDDSWKGTFRILRPDGETRWVSDHHMIIRDDQGRAIRTLGVKTDVTKRKKNDEELARHRMHLEDLIKEKKRQLRETEQQLYQSQKLEAIGQLAGGIAHDLNNLLTVILGFGESLQEEAGPDHPHHADLAEIIDAGNRAASLTSQLLAFSRRQTLQPKTLSLNTILINMEKMLGRLIGEDVTLSTFLAPDLWPVRVDPGQMEQVVMNLAVNARDAMPRGGRLTLETANMILDDSYTKVHKQVKPGPFAVLMVTDTGSGMDQETQNKIFEPFYTTKKKGEGTGLGLSTVYGIVKQSGGFIWLYSEQGTGSTFKIYFPRAQGPEDVLKPGKPSRTESRGETVLVVEDEASLHLLLKRMIESRGYVCVVEADPEAALAKVKASEIRPDLLMTDVIMPKMSGKSLAEEMIRSVPDLRVLYMSGYTDNTIVKHGVLEDGVHFIQKPFNSHTLAVKIREVLG